MKKLFLAILVTIAFAACTPKATETQVSATDSVDITLVDTLAVDTLAVEPSAAE